MAAKKKASTQETVNLSDRQAPERDRAYYQKKINAILTDPKLTFENPKESAIIVEIDAWAASEKVVFLQEIFLWILTQESIDWQIIEAIEYLLEQQLSLTYDQVVEFYQYLSKGDDSWRTFIATNLAKHLRQLLKTHPITPELRQSIVLLSVRLSGHSHHRQSLNRLRELVTLPEEQDSLPIEPGEAWSDVALYDLHALPAADRNAWAKLLNHCAPLQDSKPKAKWIKEAQRLLLEIDPHQFDTSLVKWVGQLDKPRTEEITEWTSWHPDPNWVLIDRHLNLFRGLIWCCTLLSESTPEPDRTASNPNLQRSPADLRRLAATISTVATTAYRKIPGFGARSVRLGNAAIGVLGALAGTAGIDRLSILKVKVKFGPAQKEIDKALTAAAARLNLSPEDLAERAVPSYGLQEVGLRRDVLGEFSATIQLTNTGKVELAWFKPDGSPQKSIPKAVKDHFAEELKELKQTVKDLQAALSAQRDRLESIYLNRQTWDWPTWQERYLNHPLVGSLTRRLIWQFSDGATGPTRTAIWHDGQLVDRFGVALQDLETCQKIELWHPIVSSTQEILDWRSWLLDQQIQQPFKQAYREIYLLTAAEENTRVYSNRFAAHILKQHQFNALCGQRGWKNQLRLMVDDVYKPAQRSLPAWNLRAEFWIEGIGDNYNIDTNETGTYLYVATDQVRFYRLAAPVNYAHAGGGGYATATEQEVNPVPIAEIPPLVLSEILRDVDLFVGVTSVGSDPTWSDGGPAGRYRDYWESYSFGELSETAKTRRAVLEQMIPRLKIRDRCEFRDRFLVVRGDLNTYKIHLGSGNILMEPDDRYLCIVVQQSASDRASQTTFLPFEGDRLLSVVLSKALLLADDRAITDPTIVSQLGRSR